MKVKDIINVLNAAEHAPCVRENIDSYYVGDFLSRVMGKAPSGCAWITVMNNINVAGVAVLADVGLIIMCEGVQPVAELIERCKTENIGLISTSFSAYEVCKNLQ